MAKIYRDRKEPYPIVNLELQQYFQTHDPEEWYGDSLKLKQYQEIYGFQPLIRVMSPDHLVCENTKKEKVYGRIYVGPEYFSGSDEPLPPPPWERKDPISKADQAILDRLDYIINLIRKE